MNFPKANTIIYFISLIVTGLLLYSNTVDAPFRFDSDPFVTTDSAVHMIDFNLASIKRAAIEGIPRNRPIPNISFAINFYFSRLSPESYHWTNIGIHIICALCLFILSKDTLFLYSRLNKTQNARTANTCDFAPDGHMAGIIALFAALIWLAHPVNSSAVIYIAQRMTSLAAMFYLLCILLYVKGRKHQQSADSFNSRSIILFTGAVLAGICALASKQNTATLPLFILLYEWVFFQEFRTFKSKYLKLIVVLTVLIFAAAGLYYLGGSPVERILNGYAHRDFDPAQRLLTEFRVVLYYISLLFFPASDRLVLDHDYPLSHSPILPGTTFFAIAAVIMLISIALYRPRRSMILFFAIVWYLGNLVIESSVIPLEIIYEHRNYLPSMLISLVFVYYGWRLLRKSPRIYIGVLVLIVLALSLETYKRNRIWHDPVVFAQNNVLASPDKFRPLYNLGHELNKAGKTKEAVRSLQRALKIEPHKPEVNSKKALAHNELGLVLLGLNKPDKAILHFSEALGLVPGYREPEVNIAKSMLKRNQPENAIAHLERFLSEHPNYAVAHMVIADAYIKLNRFQKALLHLQSVLDSEPDNPIAHNHTGNILARQGRNALAIDHFHKAIRVAPDYVPAYTNLGNALAQAGQFQTAIDSYEKALAIDPDDPKARQNMEKIKRAINRL